MIVRDEGDSLLLITQPDHAALSGEIMTAWQRDDFPTRPTRPLVLAATHDHDDGWREVDSNPPIDPANGRPYDFVTIPDEVKRSIWPRAVLRLATRHAAVGALVAQHALTIFRRYRDDAGWRPWLGELARRRDELIAAAGEWTDAGEAFARDYRIVFLGDLLSLIFCNGWTERFEAEGYRAWLEGGRLHVAPDPFAATEVPLEVAARRIARRRYESAGDLGAALARAPEVVLRGVAAGATND